MRTGGAGGAWESASAAPLMATADSSAAWPSFLVQCEAN